MTLNGARHPTDFGRRGYDDLVGRCLIASRLLSLSTPYPRRPFILGIQPMRPVDLTQGTRKGSDILPLPPFTSADLRICFAFRKNLALM